MVENSIKKIIVKADEYGVPYFQSKNGFQFGYGIKGRELAFEDYDNYKVVNDILNDIEQGRISTIPIFAVTGTNGKTTTARLIYHILMALGCNTGLCYTGGILIGSKKIREGDTTGLISARELLMDRTVEAAVLETARGGIIRNGLGYEKALAGIITNVSEDHLGLEGVNTLEDLARVKSAVINNVSSEGKIIVKAQKELIELVRDKPISKVCLFSLDKNKYIIDHIEVGGEALLLEEDWVTYYNNYKRKLLINVKELAFTHFGASRSNVLNIMAAFSAVMSLSKDYNKMVDILSKIKCDEADNAGRQNLIDLGRFKIVLDYGHNPEAYEEVFSFVRNLKPSRVAASIICPGDRTDEHIRKLGLIAGRNSDFLILREPDHARGREKKEILNFFREGAESAGLKSMQIIETANGTTALKVAMDNAVEGEVVVMFIEDINEVIPLIHQYKTGILTISEKYN